MEQQVFIPIVKQCGVCAVACNEWCGGCNAVYYCCIAHQKQDWPRHKTQCALLQQGKKVTLQPAYVTNFDGSRTGISDEDTQKIVQRANDSLMDFAYHYINQCKDEVRKYSDAHERCFVAIKMIYGEDGPVKELPYVAICSVETDAKKFTKLARAKDLRKYVREYDIDRELPVVIWNSDGSFSKTLHILQPWILQ